MNKPKNLQPLLDYFGVLRRHEQEGYLEVMPAKHEAYITRAALHALVPDEMTLRSGVPMVARHIRAYAAWMFTASDDSQSGPPYLTVPFALHVVKEEVPHDLLYTFLLSRRRAWWRLWRMTECVEVIYC